LLQPHWFAEVFVGSGSQAAIAIAFHCQGCQGDDGDLGNFGQLANPLHGFQPTIRFTNTNPSPDPSYLQLRAIALPNTPGWIVFIHVHLFIF